MPIITKRYIAITSAIVLFCWASCVCADEPRPLKPTKTANEGRYKIQWFAAQPGDTLLTERGGKLDVIEIREQEAVLKRTFRSVWVVGEYNLGNGEYLKITSIDAAKQTVSMRLQTKTKSYPWEAFSF